MIILGGACFFAIHSVHYVNEEGNTETGFTAAQKLKTERKKWAGELTEEIIIRVIEENNRINNTAEAQSQDVQKQNIAFSWKQGFYDIRNLLVYSYGKFREYDYYLPDSLVPEDAEDFYSNRLLHLQEWLNTEAEDQFKETEKTFLGEKYKELETPLIYDYAVGWNQLFEYAPTVLMIMMLILGFLVANIFSGEFQLKTDAIFYSSYHGRGKAVMAKIKAGILLTTVIYWITMLTYSVIVLGILGLDGVNNAIQTSMKGWKSFYNITYWQEYLMILIGGYIGTIFITLLTMLVSAKMKSAIMSVMVPFILIFIPSFLSGSSMPIMRKIMGLLPDQLLQMNNVVVYYNLYSIGGEIVGAAIILLVLYLVLSILLLPILYQVYKRIEVKE